MADPSPLDFEDIREQRNERVKQLTEKATARLRGVGIERPKSTTSLRKSDPLDNFTVDAPTSLEQTGYRSPNDPEGITQSGIPKKADELDNLPSFGRGLVGALRDVREGTVKNVPGFLKPLALPFVKAGQGALAGMEWGANVAETVAPYVVEQIQHVMPGRQELERRVSERQKTGQSRAEAVRAAWDETNLEAPFEIPFWTTAFTPNGSIQVDFQDVIEVGLDPIELALLFGTGGTSTGLGVVGALARKTSTKAGLRTAVAESLGVRGSKALSRKASQVPGFVSQEIRTGAAGSREALSSIPSAVRSEVDAVGDMVSGRGAEKRRASILDMDADPAVTPTIAQLLPTEEIAEQAFTKNWRFDTLLNKVPEWIRGGDNTARYKAVLGMGDQTFNRIIRLADPSSVVGNDVVSKANVLYLNMAARLGNSVSTSLSKLDRQIFRDVFNIDEMGAARVDNIKVTPTGNKKFLSKGFSAKEIAEKEATGWQMNDLAEAAIADVMEQSVGGGALKRTEDALDALQDEIKGLRKSIDEKSRATIGVSGPERAAKQAELKLLDAELDAMSKRRATLNIELEDAITVSQGATRSRAQSWFTGLTVDQAAALDRLHAINKEWLDYALKEGAIEVKDGRLLGFRFKDEATGKFIQEEFGDPSTMLRYSHKQVVGKDIYTEAGDTEFLLFDRHKGKGAGGSSKGNIFKNRLYETAEENARAGQMLATPDQAFENMAQTIVQMVSEKRTRDFLTREGHDWIADNAQVFERLNPRLMENIANADGLVKSSVTNLNKLTKRIGTVKGNNRVDTAVIKERIKDLGRLNRVSVRDTNRLERQMLDYLNKLGVEQKLAEPVNRAKTARINAPHISAKYERARKSTQKALDKYRSTMSSLSEDSSQLRGAASRINTSRNHVTKWNEEAIGLTTSVEMAAKEVELATIVLDKLRKVKTDRMNRIIDSQSLKAKAFGETDLAKVNAETGVGHFRNGPLKGLIAKDDVFTDIEKAFGDEGHEVLSKIQQVTGTARTLAAGSADIGWPAIQGSLLAVTHPLIFAKSTKRSLEAIFQPAKLDEFVRDNLPDVIDFLKNEGDLGSSDFFTAIDQTGMLSSVTNWMTIKEGRTPQWLPAGGGRTLAPRGSRAAEMANFWGRDVRPIGRLGAGFNTFMDVAKIEMWKSFKPSATLNIATKRELAAHINNMMGTLNTQMLGVKQTQRQIEGGMLLFSPRFTRSAFAVAGQAMKAFTGGAAGAGQAEGLATRESVRAMSGMVAGATFAMGGIALATGQWEEFKENGLDPMKPGWLTVEIGGQRVGVGGSTRSLLDLVFKSTASMAELNGRQAKDLSKWNIFDPLHRAQNPIPNFWLNRTAPGVRELLLSETFDGEGLDTPAEYFAGIAPKFLPFAAQNYMSPGQGNAHPSVVAGIPESIGLRARPLSIFERREAVRDELSMDAFKKKWEDLDIDQRRTVQRTDELSANRLSFLDEVVTSVESPTLGRYYADKEANRDMINDQLSQSILRFNEHGNGHTLKEEHDAIMREARNSNLRLESIGGHESAIEYLQSKRTARLGGESLFNQVYDEYVNEVKDIGLFEDEITGIIDWDARDNAERDFRGDMLQEFGKSEGQKMYDRMKNLYVGLDVEGDTFATVPDYPGQDMHWALRQARNTLNEVRYWQQAKDVIGDNQEMLELWQSYETADPLTKQAMTQQYRGLARIAQRVGRRRTKLRRADAAVDKALIDFYGHRAVNIENRRGERVRMRELRSTV